MTDLNAEMAFLQSMQSSATDSYLPKPTGSTAGAGGEGNEEEEEDYDPSDLSYENSSHQNTSNQNMQTPTVPRDTADVDISASASATIETPNVVTEAKPSATKQPRTIGGFVVDDDDDEDDEEENGDNGDGGNEGVESGSRLDSKPVGEELGKVNENGRPASVSKSVPRRSASRTPQGLPAQGTASVPVISRERTASLDVSSGVANSNSVNVTTVTIPVSDHATSTENKVVSNQPSSVPLSRGPSAQGSAETSAPKARLPHDRVGILEDRIAEDPKGDVDAWLNLINEHRRRNKIEDARIVYERFFKIFPTAVRHSTLQYWTRPCIWLTSVRQSNGSHMLIWNCKMMTSIVLSRSLTKHYYQFQIFNYGQFIWIMFVVVIILLRTCLALRVKLSLKHMTLYYRMLVLIEILVRFGRIIYSL